MTILLNAIIRNIVHLSLITDMTKWNILGVTASFFLFLSCTNECTQVKVEKAEWVTRYENYSVDTLASYSVTRDYFNFEESFSSQIRTLSDSYNQLGKNINLLYSNIDKNSTYNDFRNKLYSLRTSSKYLSGRNYVNRTIVIRNNSDFSANFAIKDENSRNSITTDYQLIQPHSMEAFQLSYSLYWNRDSNSDFNSEIIVLQKKTNVSLIRRIDELHLSSIEVNTCEQSVEALEKQYQAVQDLYNEKVDTADKKIVREKNNIHIY